MNLKFYLTFVLIVIALSGFAQVTSTFDTDTENWHSEGDGDYLWEATTGNPGGCFRVNDDAIGDMNRAYAPVKFLGDWSAATTSDSVSADIFLHDAGGGYIPSNFVFRIVGPGGSAKAIYDPIPMPPNDTWINYSVHFIESNWLIESGTWAGILDHVTQFIVTMEYISGNEWNRLDNVILSVTPISVPLAPVICSDFESGLLEGWSFTGVGGFSIVTTGGNPGKYVKITEGSGTSIAVPSSIFHGNWSLLDGHNAEIHVDYLITSTTGALLLPGYFVKLSGPGGVATYPCNNSIELAYNKWHSFGIPIEQAGWTMVSGDWTSLMNNVTDIKLAAEFNAGSEIVGIDNFCISNLPPVTDFTAKKTFVFLGDNVQFQDHTASAAQTWDWDFGETGSSTEVNPIYQYSLPGTYSVSLTTTNYFGSNTETKTDYIEVYPVDQCLKFADNFNDNSIHQAWSTVNGTWAEASGNIRQTSNHYVSGDLLGGCFALIGSLSWEDYILSCDMRSTDDDDIGFVFNWQDGQNMYMFRWNKQANLRWLYKWVNGVATTLASDAVGYSTNTWYQIDIFSIAGKLVLAINGTQIFSVNDNTFSAGKAGLFCSGNQGSYWDNFRVECAGTPVELSAFLEGPFEGTEMNTGLIDNLILPLSNPYTVAPWNHSGTEGVLSFTNPDVVDWVLVDFRDAATAGLALPATSLGTYAALLLKNGDIISPYGGMPLYLNEEISNNLYIAVFHRNHLGIISSNPVTLSGGIYSYDFTTGSGQAYGSAAQKELAFGIYGMYAGDFNADGTIDSNDKTSLWMISAGKFGYLHSDGDFDGQADNNDKNDFWFINKDKSSQVPE